MAHVFTGQNFQDEVIQSEIPVLVDFYAPWCGPCQGMLPIVEKLSSEYEGKVKIGKINVDESENKSLSNDYGIMGIPAFKIFKGGKVVREFSGGRSEGDLRLELEKVL